ncbi:hypothetical protein P3T76_015227 [Phytophthora citrophthora]|uniref:Protein kinase domain-containing protein n=1 Tax=Phytophthora citrophthora TaxID=4793 RepID=A0AAD9G067_9STRA|nr:hypothetical protein P3T76_015227 [Phytophthora citrophthora]
MVVPRERQLSTPQTYHESFVEIREVFKRQRQTIDSYCYQQQTRATAELPHKAPKSYTTAWIGLQERLRLDDLMIDIAPLENGETFWSVEVQTYVDIITKEADLDTFIAPYLNDVLARYDLVLIKSAEPWLAQDVVPKSTTILKPDVFATHAGMYRAKPMPNNGVQQFRFGVAVEELYDCVFLFERQLTITDEAFGQMIQYLENLTQMAYGILFDRHSFWLIESYNSAVVKVEKSTWVSKGSKDSLQNFIMKKLSPCPVFLARACSSLSVDVVEGDAFLGRGTHSVFKVIRSNGEVMALKIAEGEDCAGRLEFDRYPALADAQDTCLTVRPVGKILEIELDEPVGGFEAYTSAALLLSPVGTPLPHPTTHEEVQQLFELLWLLHNNGILHHNSRVQNVIVSEGKLLWISLVEPFWDSSTTAAKLKEMDAMILARSILHLGYGTALGPVLEQLITNYGNNSTVENVNLLAKVVHQLMNP